MRIARYSHQGKTGYGVIQDDDTVCELKGCPFESTETGETVGSLSDVKLLAPVEPSKVVGVGANYMLHIKEGSGDAPAFPMIFLCPPSAVIGPDEPIVIPNVEGDTCFEGELVAVIGKEARKVSEENALDYVLGYTCGNDVSTRDIQSAEMATGVLLRGKGFDTFKPMGPWISTDLDPTNLTLKSRVNGEEKQNTSTSDLLFTVAHLISDMTQAFTLCPGDVIYTGTPAGCGPVQAGDVVEVEISGVGTLSNPVVSDS